MRPALLLIDMQNDFVREGKPLRVAGAEAIIPRVRFLLDLFRERRLPVVHVLRVHRPDGSDVEIMRQEIFRRTPFAVDGTEGAEVISELAPAGGEFTIRKIRMSAFLGTDLDLLLRSIGVDTVVVAGIQTPNCVRTTVFDAMACNYRTVLVDDAVAAQSDEIHRCNVRDMERIGVKILTASGMPTFLSRP
ncbi:MAG: cysteine hydrolase [Methanomicrobiales archaeon]|nr:cysteine hydrolase [Methanomicrobiales archaeon]